MPNLLLHCGGHAVDRAAVDASPTPTPTDTWQPVPHGTLLDLVERTLDHHGLAITQQAHALNRDGDRYFGLMQLGPVPGSGDIATGDGGGVSGASGVSEGSAVFRAENGGDDLPGSGGGGGGDYAFVVGLRNSHDQSFPASLVIGSAVFVCDNLAFSGEVVLARRHTRFIVRDLPEMVDRAVGQLGDLRVNQDRRIAAYRQTPVTAPQAHHLLVSMLDARVLPVTRLPSALDEFRRPSHETFLGNDGRPTAWTLMNAVTESIKGRNLDQLPRRTQAMHGLLDSHCGLNTTRGVSVN